MKAVNFDKYSDGLVPTIVQDAQTRRVLMLGFMNAEALQKTIELKKVTFFSRSKQRLWTKGETSNNFLELVDYKVDCDQDTILIFANPKGPTCHTGADTCFEEDNEPLDFLRHLEKVIQGRKGMDATSSYTAQLFEKGSKKIAQKVGEEAVEIILEAEQGTDERLLSESADFLYHFLVLLASRNLKFDNVLEVLKERHK